MLEEHRGVEALGTVGIADPLKGSCKKVNIFKLTFFAHLLIFNALNKFPRCENFQFF